MNSWVVTSQDQLAASVFPGLDETLKVEGEEINANWMSRLVKVSHTGKAYYVKSYASRGRGLRRFLGRSRLRAEWENLQKFSKLGIPCARVVAYGERQKQGVYSGALVTQEVPDTLDLQSLVQQEHPIFLEQQWRRCVIRRLSESVRTLHLHGFVHNDLKWRNILVNPRNHPEVYLIDCPLGRSMFGPFLGRGKVKDLACLDKVGKRKLTRQDRLRFFLAYKNRDSLNERDKMEVQKILTFFEGRD